MKKQFVFIRNKFNILYMGYENVRFNWFFRNLFLLLLVMSLIYFTG